MLWDHKEEGCYGIRNKKVGLMVINEIIYVILNIIR